MSYNWRTESWTIPLNLTVGKMVAIGETPVKLELDFDYYVEQPAPFGPEWKFGFNVTPVVKNIIAEFFKGR